MIEFLNDLLKRLTTAGHKPELIALPGTPGGAVVVVRDDFEVKTIPAKAETPGRRHVFADVESFAAFVRKHWPEGKDVEVLADTDRIVGVNRAAWFRDEVTATLPYHPDFAAWGRLWGKAIPQRALVRELSALMHTLRPEEGIVGHVQGLDVSTATEVVAKVTDHGNFEVTGKRETTQLKTKLPSSFFVRVPVYVDRDAHEIAVGLVIEEIGKGETVFSLRPKNLEVVKLAAYRAEVARLRELLGDAYLVGAGALRIEA